MEPMELNSAGVRRRGQPSSDSTADAMSGEAAKPKRDFSAPLEGALKFMQQEKFEQAIPILEEAMEGLEKEEKDAACLHNLGVCYSELGGFLQAEEAFWDAFELIAKDSEDVFRTMYGLASCLTAQDDACKLVQAEALLREVLTKGMARQNKDIMQDMYRSYVLLAENLQRQKKWSDCAECWEAAVSMGGSMFGEDHEMVDKHRKHLARATRLGRWQGRIRIVTRTLTVLVPACVAYYIYYTWPPAALAHWYQEPAAERPGVHPGL